MRISKIVLFLLTSILFSQHHTNSQIEFVESFPVETNLDLPDIRNTTEVWLEMINSAKRTLEFEQFYISNKPGESLELILNAIISAANRGVKVRFIVDSRMYRTYPETVDWLGKHLNIQVRVIDFNKLAGGVQHSKYFIVDEEELFIGSQNFDWRSLTHIHELGLRIKNKDLVRFYHDLFELDWQYAEQNKPELFKSFLKRKQYSVPFRIISETDTIKLLPTCSPKPFIPDTLQWDESRIMELLKDSKREICLQFLSYSPVGRDNSYYPFLDNALRSASARGVKVKMIISDWEKDYPAVFYLKSLAILPNIEIKYSVIPEWSGGYISYARVDHCKYIVVDGERFWLGSSNGEKSYFYTSRNVGIIVDNKSLSEKLREFFFHNWESEYTELIRSEVEYKPREHGER